MTSRKDAEMGNERQVAVGVEMGSWRCGERGMRGIVRSGCVRGSPEQRRHACRGGDGVGPGKPS